MRSARLILIVAGAGSCVSLLAQPTTPSSVLPRLVIEAGEIARTNAWVTVALPSTVRGSDLQLRQEQTGEIVPLQVGPDREGWALVPSIPAEQVVRYRIEPALRETTPDRAVAVRDVSRVRVSVEGRPAFTYVGEPLRLPPGVEDVYERGGYIHPVLTPSGRRVTEDYPPNHKHHHGIWAAWTSTRFAGRAPDFWNMGDRKGRVEFERLGRAWSGPLTAGFQSRHRYMDLLAPTPATVLLEDWRVVAYAQPASASACPRLRPRDRADARGDDAARTARLPLWRRRHAGAPRLGRQGQDVLPHVDRAGEGGRPWHARHVGRT